MNIVEPTFVADPAAEQNCPPFCLRHDPGVPDLCIGPAVELDFGPADPDNRDLTHHARILTYNEPGNIVTLSLIINGASSADFTPAQARQIGTALIQAADNATVPNVLADRRLTLVHGGA